MLYDFFAQSEISLRVILQLCLYALEPNLTHILRNVAHARVKQKIGFGCDKSEMDHNRKSGDLPGAVGDECVEKSVRFLPRISVQEFTTPGAVACVSLSLRFVPRVGRKTGAAKILFL